MHTKGGDRESGMWGPTEKLTTKEKKENTPADIYTHEHTEREKERERDVAMCHQNNCGEKPSFILEGIYMLIWW